MITDRLYHDSTEKQYPHFCTSVKIFLAFYGCFCYTSTVTAIRGWEYAKALFGAGGNNANMPTSTLTDADFENGNINVLSMLVATGLCPSRGEARRLVQQGGVTIDDVKVASIDESLAHERFEGEGIIVRKGKKVFHRVKV